jgi:hypothetical protein
MGKYNNRVEKALIILDQRVEIIYNTYEAPNFVEVVGSIGGDTVTYRVYDDGTVTER